MTDPNRGGWQLRDYLPVTRGDLSRQMSLVWDYVITETTSTVNALNALGARMAADRDLLAQIAAGMTALAAPVTDLIASEAALRARVVELEGAAAADEAGDLAAAQEVKAAFDDLAAKFTAEPESPDVDPLPEPEPNPEPSDPGSDPEQPV